MKNLEKAQNNSKKMQYFEFIVLSICIALTLAAANVITDQVLGLMHEMNNFNGISDGLVRFICTFLIVFISEPLIQKGVNYLFQNYKK